MSRSSAFIAAVLVSVLSLATAAWANTPEPPAVTVAADPVGAAILDRLDRLKAARGRTDAERALVEQIAAFYRGRDLAPVWGDGATIGAKAAATIDEIRLAGDFGLDPVQFDLPKLAVSLLAPAEYADIEARLSFAVVKYASHAAGGRIAPVQLSKWLDQRPGFVNAAAVLRSVADAADPAAALRRTHPQHAGFERLRQAWLAARGKSAAVIVAVADAPIPMGRKLNVWDENPDVPVIRRRLGLKDRPQAAEEYDDAMAKAVRALRRELGRPVNGVIDDGIRRVLNARSSAALPATAAKNPELAKKLLVNMERWRWLPNDLGSMHIWNNLPEYETRVVKAGRVVHQERIIIGRPETQTPVFSDALKIVVFQPNWGVPPSIKVRTILPRLQDGDESVLSDKNMRIVVNGKTMDPAKYNWDKIDIRTVPIIQDPGPDNPLGQIKFLFPNKHDVYMHDTPSKGLFNQGSRAMSNGCIRVRDPRKLAEIVFAEERGWAADDIAPLLTATSPANNRIDLARKIPVHNVYFTVQVDEDGKLRTFGDVYAHDKRIEEALAGRPAAEIAERDPARKLEAELEDISPTKQKKKS